MSKILSAKPKAESPSEKSLVLTQESFERALQECRRERIEVYKRTHQKFTPDSENTIGTQYRFRAECKRDADLLLMAINDFIEPSWTMTQHDGYPDAEVVFKLIKPLSSRDLLWIACSIVDGHVMVQTLERAEEYTGKREYGRDIDLEDPATHPNPAVIVEVNKGINRYVDYLEYLIGDAQDFVENLNANYGGCKLPEGGAA